LRGVNTQITKAELETVGGPNVQLITGLSNAEFFGKFAAAGCVGLVGGTTLVDRIICRAQRHVDQDKQWSFWSHAFLIQGERVDGRCWVIESDLDVHRKHIRLGVQENRIDKFFNEDLYATVAILDFQLSAEQSRTVVREGLNLVADRARYSLRELFGTLVGLRHQTLRGKANLLAREKSFFCSAFVQHLFRRADIDLVPGLDVKHTTPEDLARSSMAHTTYLLKREVATSRLAGVREHLRARQARRKSKRLS
jgi:hypothetical protein